MTTEEMNKALLDIRAAMVEHQEAVRSAQVERHKSNGVIHAAILEMGTATMRRDTVLGQIQADVVEVKTAVMALTQRMLGNEPMHIEGFVHEIDNGKKRMTQIEITVAAMDSKMTLIQNRVIGGFITITGLAGLYAWIQSHFSGK